MCKHSGSYIVYAWMDFQAMDLFASLVGHFLDFTLQE